MDLARVLKSYKFLVALRLLKYILVWYESYETGTFDKPSKDQALERFLWPLPLLRKTDVSMDSKTSSSQVNFTR